MIAAICTAAWLVYMASFQLGYILGLLCNELFILTLNEKASVYQSGYMCSLMSCSAYEPVLLKQRMLVDDYCT
jgi:hypothetical protein